MPKRYIPYARVSSDEQFEKGNSIPGQIEQCVNYINRLGGEALPPITDDTTGTSLDRKGLTQVRELLRSGKAEGVVVYRSDRLTRDLGHSLLLREEFRRLGVEIHFANRGKSSNSPEGRMMDNVEGVFNEYWRTKLIEDTSSGRDQKAKQGKFVGCGSIPYGYRYDSKEDKISIHEPEARIIRKIYQLYVCGDESSHSMSMRAIAMRLTNDHDPLPIYRGKKTIGEHVWSPVTVALFLRNETYAGVWYWGKSKMKLAPNRQGEMIFRSVPAPKGEWTAVSILPIVARDIWEMAQAMRKTKKEKSPRNGKHYYMLSNMIYCGHCKKKYHGLYQGSLRAPVKGKYYKYYRYYQCSVQKSRKLSGETANQIDKSCNTPTLNADWIENEVWKGVLKYLRDDELFEKGIQEAIRQMRDQQAPLRERLVDVESLLLQFAEQNESLISAIRYTKAGTAAHDALTRQLEEISHSTESIEGEKITILSKLDKTITPEYLERAREARRKAVLGLSDPTPENIRHTLELLVCRVTIDTDKITVSCDLAIPDFIVAYKDSCARLKYTGRGRCRAGRWGIGLLPVRHRYRR